MPEPTLIPALELVAPFPICTPPQSPSFDSKEPAARAPRRSTGMSPHRGLRSVVHLLTRSCR